MPPNQTLRYADSETARRYPLEIQGPSRWHHRDGAWRVELPLPDLMPGTILVPSLTLARGSERARPDAPAGARPAPAAQRYRWTLQCAEAAWPLQEVPSSPQPVPKPVAGGPVSPLIDCYHIHRKLPAPRLHLALDTEERPGHYLIAVSSRALTLAAPPLPERAVSIPEAPPARSQMEAPAGVARRICSPTCVSMVLALWQRSHDWQDLVAECHDPATDLYGVWPLAIRAAARRGALGAVEVFANWSEPLAALAKGVPLITSIRFSRGELPEAALDETGGHLVVVYGAGPKQIHVCDPAAATAAEVHRVYPADAFSGAWLRHRGAAYILPP